MVTSAAPAITRYSASTSSAISNGACCAGATPTVPRTGRRCWCRSSPATVTGGCGDTSAPMPPLPCRRSTRFLRRKASSTPSGCRPIPAAACASCRYRSGTQLLDQPQDLGEQRPRDRHFRKLEGHVPAVAHHLGADLDELVAQRRQ